MSKRLVVSIVVAMAAGMFSPLLGAQTDAPQAAAEEKWNNVPPPLSTYKDQEPSGPGPRRDISGIWDGGSVIAMGAPEHPARVPGREQPVGRPDETGAVNPLPYTPLGLEALKAHLPSRGMREVDMALSNGHANTCDPIGFPYGILWELRALYVVQDPLKVIMINPYGGLYRIIWTDGRALPTEPDSRWNGYSVGRWVDDYTFVVETTGLNPKSWIDHAGRPHSEQLRVEETFHRVDRDNLALTMRIIDPVMYTEPWFAMDEFPLHRLPPDFDIRENLCSPTENQLYNELYGVPAIRDSSLQ